MTGIVGRLRGGSGGWDLRPLRLGNSDIIVKNGNVTLEWAASTATRKTIAGIRANSPAGVFSVTNDLVVLSEVEQ